MIQDPRNRSVVASPELVDDPVGLRPHVTPEPVAPVTRLRSPLMEHREIQPAPDEVPLETEEDDERQRHGDERRCHQEVPLATKRVGLVGARSS